MVEVTCSIILDFLLDFQRHMLSFTEKYTISDFPTLLHNICVAMIEQDFYKKSLGEFLYGDDYFCLLQE